jgi:hypothetical protein
VTTKAELVEAMARAMCTYQDQDPDRVLESMDKNRQPVIMWTHWKGEADAALSVLRQWLADEGLAVVPREATAPMADVGAEARWQSAVRDANNVREIYRAMIAAAPDALETKP